MHSVKNWTAPHSPTDARSLGARAASRSSARPATLGAELCEQRARLIRRARGGIRLRHLLPALARALGLLERAIAETDLQHRLRDLCALGEAVHDILEFGHRLRKIALAIVRFPDPELRARGQRMLR